MEGRSMPRSGMVPQNETEALIQLADLLQDVKVELATLNRNMERVILAVSGGEPRRPRPGTRP